MAGTAHVDESRLWSVKVSESTRFWVCKARCPLPVSRTSATPSTSQVHPLALSRHASAVSGAGGLAPHFVKPVGTSPVPKTEHRTTNESLQIIEETHRKHLKDAVSDYLLKTGEVVTSEADC